MVRDLVASDIPIRHEGEVGVVDGSVIGHLGRAAVGVLTVGQELIDSVEGIGLNSVIGGEYNELRNVGLKASLALRGMKIGSTIKSSTKRNNLQETIRLEDLC